MLLVCPVQVLAVRHLLCPAAGLGEQHYCNLQMETLGEIDCVVGARMSSTWWLGSETGCWAAETVFFITLLKTTTITRDPKRLVLITLLLKPHSAVFRP